MHAVILAAGVASRLRPLTDSTPKCLLPVAGKPILRRQLESLQRAGVADVVIVTGWLEEQIHIAVRSWFPTLRVTFVSNIDYADTNNEYSLWLCRSLVAGRAFLVLDADIVFDQEVLDAVLRASYPNALAMRPDSQLGDEEMKAEVDDAGRVLRISKRIDPKRAKGEVPGVSQLSSATSRRLFDVIESRVIGPGIRGEFYEASMDILARAGEPFYVVDVGPHYLAEIDSPDDLVAVDAAVRAREAPIPAGLAEFRSGL